MFPELKNADIFGRIIIGDNVHVGSGSIIMPGVSIGSNCIIGCGAIVTKDVPDNSVAVGIPARVIESIDEYKIKNMEKMLPTKGLPKNEKEKVIKDYFGLQ